MGIVDLKARLADIPGIETLTMTEIGGRACYSFAGKIAAVDPNASDSDIDAAIRFAASSTAIAQFNAPAPTASPAKGTPMSITGAGAAGLSIKALFEKQKAKIAADLEANMAKIQDGFDKQNAAVAAVGSLGDKVHAEADDLMASIGQFTNDITGQS